MIKKGSLEDNNGAYKKLKLAFWSIDRTPKPTASGIKISSPGDLEIAQRRFDKGLRLGGRMCEISNDLDIDCSCSISHIPCD